MAHSIMTEMTKLILSKSLKKLLSKKPLNKITVKDIVSDCKLTRQTFYYHFQDIFELLDWTYKNEIGHILEEASNSSWDVVIKGILSYIKDNKSMFAYTIQSVGREHFEQAVYPNLYEFSQNKIYKASSELEIPSDKIRFLANLQTITLLSVIIQWANNGMKENIDEIVQMLDMTLNSAMSNVLQEYESESSNY
ncbi:TetR/AcrR family transcriptional regulator C-terminal domain-containing protein [Sedimentibacter hydroxybenzoicus DSM 7310]|uniref:TetR/AcrR family transcriptional regulator C-terminal domain-containing protein n=1 Tax=Sedimentibacter hydroxybenzoicus DSM 7310 TaxID=1123245 RepID=A0A974BL00_SEDHY|nr:TetR-like C-terminal domain-containing protein [Sedimentibacter hydroxybenzoicus]NYB74672.1 TetR/AcrR family transcriptional regulator C-terminal domain-containing protein [Sedimentibacter hydroxybenzoicus DSM 7310]